jgi:hypothetical protein
MSTPSILVRSSDTDDSEAPARYHLIGYRISDLYGLTTTLSRAEATVFPSLAAASAAAGHGDHAVPADWAASDVARAIWGCR